jgi:hypothetical protein
VGAYPDGANADTYFDVITRDGKEEHHVKVDDCWFANQLTEKHPRDIMKYRISKEQA